MSKKAPRYKASAERMEDNLIEEISKTPFMRHETRGSLDVSQFLVMTSKSNPNVIRVRMR